MLATHFLHRHAETLEHVLGYRTMPQQSPVLCPETSLDHFTIALARQVGTPALEVASEVGQRLGWPVYERELPQMIASHLHLPLSVVEEIDERRQSWLLECLEAFCTHQDLSESRYFRTLTSVIRSLGEQGRCILVGHGAGFILPPRTTLRVRLVGYSEDRIANVSRRLHLDHWSAARKVDEINRERTRFLRDHFHLDPSKARHYDLVLNTSQWSVADCADFIVQALQHKATEHPTA